MKTHLLLLALSPVLFASACSPFKAATFPPLMIPNVTQESAPIDSVMASTVYRIDASTINLGTLNPAGVDTRMQPLLVDEVMGAAAFTANARMVPDPTFDTDGRFNRGDASSLAYGYLATVKGRPSVICGLIGTVAARIADCATQNAATSTWEGAKYGQSGEGNWNLVSLVAAAGGNEGATCTGGAASGCFEIWQDQRTQLVWSDAMTAGNGYAQWTKGYNWFQASGYSSAMTTKAYTGSEGAAGQGADCAGAACQPTIPISACAFAASLAGLNGVPKYQNPDGSNGTIDESPAKGKMTGANMQWRLPTREDWELADVDGVRKVLPNMDQTFWTASSDTISQSIAWSFNGALDSIGEDARYFSRVVRCLGVDGTGAPASGLAAKMAAQAYRRDTSTIPLATFNPPVAKRYQPRLADELIESAAFADNSRLVPDPQFDNDGFYQPGGGTPLKFGFLETVKGRPKMLCGLSGTTGARVTDCAVKNGYHAIWQGAAYGQSGEGDWKLVTYTCATSGCFEVWQDQRTQLIWSDSTVHLNSNGEKGYNWFQAAGYSSSSSTKTATSEEAQSGVGFDCSGIPCQPSLPVSVCADASILAGQNGVALYQNPDGTNGTTDERPAKGGMSGPEHQWRLPTREDWELADVDGIRKVLPNMNQTFWSSSSNSIYAWGAWTFTGGNGLNLGLDRFANQYVRCVGR